MNGGVTFEPTRAAGLSRLEAFLPNAGRTYAARRNHDLGPDDRSNVSALSPWIRCRLIEEETVLARTLDRHTEAAAEKFVQEVIWRAYFKGWLEQHPSVWTGYVTAVRNLTARLEADASLARDHADAISGRTGIDCFDAWTGELRETGYLHNHARMWFASIWIFTLRLPWQLGAQFFLDHLLDGDPASNTLSWRWVGGLHTRGKTYLARADNIAQYTDGRFNPAGQLARHAEPLDEPGLPVRTGLAVARPIPATGRIGLLITPEDLSADTAFPDLKPAAILALARPCGSHPAGAFAAGGISEAARLAEAHFGLDVACRHDTDWTALILEWAGHHALDAIVTAHAPAGPVATALAEAGQTLPLPIIQVMRAYDRLMWPHATRGFFAVKKKIPGLLDVLIPARGTACQPDLFRS